MGPALARDLPEVEAVTRFNVRRSVVFHRGDRSFTDHRVAFADSSFFDVFGGFELLRGSRETALDGTKGVVLTASTAERLFGQQDVVGKTLQADESTWRVMGVMADVPEPSHVHFDAVAALGAVPSIFQDNWTGFAFYTYAKLAAGTLPNTFDTKLGGIAERYAVPQIQENFDLERSQIQYRFFAQPLTSIHLQSHLQDEIQPNGSVATVYAFSAIGLFILLIACINFMNLATARAAERATEVGMRKALGARRGQIAGQFFGESVLMTGGAFVLALALARAAIPFFNDVAGTDLTVSSLLGGPMLLTSVGLVALVGLLAGSYPAVVLSGFRPTEVLGSADRRRTGGGGRLRRGLVAFQFAISIVLIVGTLVVHEQFGYIQEKQLGLEKERVVEIEQAGVLGERQPTFVERARRVPGVTAAGAADPLFGRLSHNAFVPDPSADTSQTEESQTMNFLQVGYGFFDAMGIEILAGRTFDPARPADSSAVLVNRAAADLLGWEKAAGHQLYTGGDSTAVYDVIGIAGNFHYQSMRTRVEPLVLFPSDAAFHLVGEPNSVYVRLAPGKPSAPLDDLQATWNALASPEPFQYAFLDQTYAALHRDTQRAGWLFSTFAVLAVLIACLGLFGLSAFAAERRKKEIAVRKSFGASTQQIVGLLSKDFLKLVGIGFLVAAPIAWYAMQRWLEGFAYRIDLGPLVFLAAGALALVVAMTTVSYQALRAARTNPAEALRDE